MPAQRDYYEILGVPRDATADQVRKAYLKLAHKYHPDKTGGDKAAEEKLKEINQAYDVLKNVEKRKKYDQFGHAGEQMGAGGFEGFGGFGGGPGGPGGAGFDAPFEDLFDVFFGRGAGGGAGGRRRSAMPGNDLEYRVTVTLREAAFGTKKTIRFNRLENCPDCNGSGAAPGSQPTRCADCGGTGQVRRSQGFFSITQTCPRCRGRGNTIDKPCPKCGGSARVRITRELPVDLPPGIATGSRLRVAGEGEPGENGGPRGDLHLYIEVEPDDIFERNGNDLVCEVPIGFPQAALGATIRVPTLKGEAELKVPPGTQSGTLFRLRGLGVPDVRGYQKGDQLVRVQVETPAKLNKEQRELLKQFQEISDEKHYPIHKKFMDKIKKSFSGE
jgi:molecular chaperone DnaJ